MAITRKEVITKAMGFEGWSDEEIEVWEKMLKSLDRKSSGKPTKAQIENIQVKNDILALIVGDEPKTAREIAEALGHTTNKVAGLLTKIVADGKAVKVKGEKSKDAPKYFADTEAVPYEVPSAEQRKPYADCTNSRNRICAIFFAFST